MVRVAIYYGLFLSLSAALIGCGQQAPQKKMEEVEERKEMDLSKFDLLHRAAVEIKSSASVGFSREAFQKLQQQLSTEIEMASEKAATPLEKELLDAYRGILEIYRDSAVVWDVKLSLPGLLKRDKDLIIGGGGTMEDLVSNMNFRKECVTKIPLASFFGTTTGLDTIVARYNIPVQSVDVGVKGNTHLFISGEAVQLLWEKAADKMREVSQLRQK